MVAIVVKPNLRGRALVISYQGGQALGSYSASKRSNVGVLFCIKPG